jgi:hypothetical protein
MGMERDGGGVDVMCITPAAQPPYTHSRYRCQAGGQPQVFLRKFLQSTKRERCIT